MIAALVALLCLGSSGLVAAQTNTGARWLSEFGPLTTPDQADATLTKAAQELIAHGGGVLSIPTNAPADWIPRNIHQGTWRKPVPPEPAKQWGNGRGVTVLDDRDGTAKISVPALTGLTLERTFALPEGESVGPWEMHPMLTLQNDIVRGSTSYREWLLADVKAGPNRRFYMRTIRGVFPGEFLNTGDSGQVARLAVKSLGYDAGQKLPYFIADVNQDVSRGTLLHNKTHVNALRLETFSQTENQTFDVVNWRHDYSQGDASLFVGRFDYMSDVHSTAGDENGVIYAAFSISEVTPFRGQVAAWDAATLQLKYAKPQNAQTLATGRPLINLSPQKMITNGMAYVLLPAGAILGWGGSIRSTDAPWTADLVGRYFAIDEPSESVPGSDSVRRWWLITGVQEKAGVKMLTIMRHWWGAKDVASITRFYNVKNFTGDEKKPKLLRYIIAPGANVFDVADQPVIRLAPGAALDFAVGDPVEQAIGPDPFVPIPFRAWLFDKVPGAFPAPVFDVANLGDVSRYSVMTVSGRQPWGTIIGVDSAAENGLVFRGDVENAAILFNQPAAITWGNPKSARASLTVTPQGNFQVQSAGCDVAGQEVYLQKFRGVKVPVPAGAQTFAVTLAGAEATKDYTVVVQPTWITNHAVTNQSPQGFTVQFAKPAPVGATLDWLLIR